MTCYIFCGYSANITNEKNSLKYSSMNFASFCHLFEGETNLIKLNLCFVFDDICHMMFLFSFFFTFSFIRISCFSKMQERRCWNYEWQGWLKRINMFNDERLSEWIFTLLEIFRIKYSMFPFVKQAKIIFEFCLCFRRSVLFALKFCVWKKKMCVCVCVYVVEEDIHISFWFLYR